MEQGFNRLTVELIRLPDEDQSVLACRLFYVDAAGRIHRPPPGMFTDGRSGPETVITGGRFSTRYLPAFLVHDHGCYAASCWPAGEQRDRYRRNADRLMLEAMQWIDRTLGVRHAGVERQAAYSFVRLGGWWVRNAPAREHYPLIDLYDLRNARGNLAEIRRLVSAATGS